MSERRLLLLPKSVVRSVFFDNDPGIVDAVLDGFEGRRRAEPVAVTRSGFGVLFVCLLHALHGESRLAGDGFLRGPLRAVIHPRGPAQLSQVSLALRIETLVGFTNDAAQLAIVRVIERARRERTAEHGSGTERIHIAYRADYRGGSLANARRKDAAAVQRRTKSNTSVMVVLRSRLGGGWFPHLRTNCGRYLNRPSTPIITDPLISSRGLDWAF